MKTIVVSDVHLGDEQCDKKAFNDFLQALKKDKELTDLVLLGDIVDMWRRDASGVFLENSDTFELLAHLNRHINVHFVAGNHDYHLLMLKNRAPHHNYPFEFKETLELQDGEHSYRFIHGYELEYGKELNFMKLVMEALCHLMSDSNGEKEDELWNYLKRKLFDIYYSALTNHSLEGEGLTIKTKSLLYEPQVRLKEKLEDIEKQANREVLDKKGIVYIFGHTHHPFINLEENVVNSGSWVKDASPHNTYVELIAGKPRLFIFGQGEILERKDIG
ncbi:MAG: metallophosphoesterase family protein [Methanomassiliicoccales archaeon]|nr:metallophosphoesterase family protein [Methanomassiliicoccales archaeon]